MTSTSLRSASGASRHTDRSYRAYLTFDAQPDAVPLALQQIDAWLRAKHYDGDGTVDLTVPGFTRVAPNAELAVVHHYGHHIHSFRVRLTETDRDGSEWVTSIAMANPDRGTGWISIRVAHSGGKPAARPKVAAHLIEVLRLRDGGYPAVAGAR